MKKIISLVLLNYLRILAKLQLFKIKTIQKLKGRNLKIIGITGSAGKTSTLLATEAVLKDFFKVKTNSGANSESGIPLNILGIKINNFSPLEWVKVALLAPVMLIANWKTYDVYIVEMGVDEPDEPKNMGYLLKILKPDIGIFLNVSAVHSMQFDKTVSESIKGDQRLRKVMENIGREKSKLINSLPKHGVAIINIEDPIVAVSTQFSRAKKITIAKSGEVGLKILKTQTGPNGFTATYSYDRKHYNLNLSGFALPEIYSISIAAALLSAVSLDVGFDKALDKLISNLKLPSGRSSLLDGINNSKIIDSSYNSSPLATVEMLKLLSFFPSPKIAILGDMRELGLQSEISHRQIYKSAQRYADIIIGVGPETQKYFISRDAINRVSTHTFQYWWQAKSFIFDQMKTDLKSWQNATILAKGSQNTIYLEELVKSLLENPLDSSKLCRQSPYWLNVKDKFQNNHK